MGKIIQNGGQRTKSLFKNNYVVVLCGFCSAGKLMLNSLY